MIETAAIFVSLIDKIDRERERERETERERRRKILFVKLFI